MLPCCAIFPHVFKWPLMLASTGRDQGRDKGQGLGDTTRSRRRKRRRKPRSQKLLPHEVEVLWVRKQMPDTAEAKKQFAEQISRYEVAWKETRDPLMVAAATTLCWSYRRPLFDWVERAIVQLLLSPPFRR